MKKIVSVFVMVALASCTNLSSGHDIDCQHDGSISALYGTIKHNKKLYVVLDTKSENEISNQVYSSLLTNLMVLDGLTHLYGIEWAKKASNPDEYLNPSTIDALCVGNLFLEKYHAFGSEKYELLGGYEDMYKLSMSYQPLYKKILEESLQLSKQAGMESMISFDCLKLIEANDAIIVNK